MISKKVLKLLNQQIALEDESSQIYLAMAVWADAAGWRGTAAFMYKQAEEERAHMYKFIKFIVEVGEQPEIAALKEPKASYKNIEEVFETALKHEKFITASIHAIMSEARKETDYAVTSFLKWFIDEQVEEEANAMLGLDIIRKAGKINEYLADKEIGAMRAGK